MNGKDYRNEHLQRIRDMKASYRLGLDLLDPHDRAAKSALRREHRAAKAAWRKEQRDYAHEHKMLQYPLMADVFDIAEAQRAEPNGRTPFDKVRVERDVVYKTVDGEELRMDIYLPDEPREGRRPVVMDIPGGGWMIHNRPRRDGYAACYAAMGAVVAVIDHRLCPKVHFPLNLADCVDAYNYLVRHAEQYDLDPDNIVVTGDSSGGHLAACLGCAATNPDYAAKLHIDAPLTRPAGLIFVSAALNFERMYRLPLTHTLIVRYVSGQPTRKAFRQWQYYRECNPQNYVDSHYPPCYNSGGITDFLCLGEAQHMARVLNKAGVDNALTVGKSLRCSDHCYVLRFPYAPARRDAVALYRWYCEREKALGVDLTAGYLRVEHFLTHYKEALAANK